MYSKAKATSVEKKDILLSKYIQPGIVEDVVLKEAKATVSPAGNPFLEITFEKDGAILTHTEWKPVMNQYVDTKEKLEEKQTNQYSRMLQILTCFYKEDEIDFEGESFEEFAKYVADMLNNANKEIKLRVKVVYNKNGYTTLPSYTKFTFIEPMVLPEGETSKIAKLSIDCFTKPIEADNETKTENPFAKTVASQTLSAEEVKNAFSEPQKTDDLPF